MRLIGPVERIVRAGAARGRRAAGRLDQYDVVLVDFVQ